MADEIMTSMLSDVINATSLQLSRDAAESILRMRLPETWADRIQELADRSSAGVLSEAEKHDFEQVVLFSNVIGLLQAQARQTLTKPTAA